LFLNINVLVKDEDFLMVNIYWFMEGKLFCF